MAVHLTTTPHTPTKDLPDLDFLEDVVGGGEVVLENLGLKRVESSNQECSAQVVQPVE